MEERAICPQCGQPLNEDIPLAIVGSILLKCPFCEMVYSFQRQEEVDCLEEEVEPYLSAGLFQKKLVFSGSDIPREADPFTRKFSCLVLFLFGPMIIFGIYWLISFLIWYVSLL
ncbi:hypothetical protein EU528_06500 [Candidatus Thorarchaeota archaeon]|nr:MAG: hypothetical protein EU528_06500 [Candidatus Thorarchaeota archaeon]